MSPEETLRSYEHALQAHDLRDALRVIANDAVFWLSDGSNHAGKEKIGVALREGFGAIAEQTYEISSARWLVRTVSTAVAVYRFRWTGVREGRPARGAGRGTTILNRREGRWLIVHEHLSRGEWIVPLQPERRSLLPERSAPGRSTSAYPGPSGSSR